MSDFSADVFAEGGGLYQRLLSRCRFFFCWVCWAHMLGCSCIHFRLKPFGMVGLLDQRMLCRKIIRIDVC